MLADELEALQYLATWFDGAVGHVTADYGEVVGKHFQAMTMCPDPEKLANAMARLPAIIAALRAAEPAQVGDADRAFELWFFRDIVDDQRSKLIALMLGGAVAKEATNHGTQRLCLKYILKALRTQGRAADQRCAELEAENARLRSELDAASDVILLAVKNAPDWAHLARAFHERRKALENRDG